MIPVRYTGEYLVQMWSGIQLCNCHYYTTGRMTGNN